MAVCAGLTPAAGQSLLQEAGKASQALAQAPKAVIQLTAKVEQGVAKSYFGTLGKQVPLDLRLQLLHETKMPAVRAAHTFTDPAFTARRMNYTLQTPSQADAIAKQALLHDVYFFITQHKPSFGMTEMGREYFYFQNPLAFRMIQQQVAQAISQQNMGMKQLATLRRSIFLEQPLQTVENQLKQLQQLAEENPLVAPETQELKMYIFHEKVAGQLEIYGAPVLSQVDGLVKQELLRTASFKYHNLEEQILNAYAELKQAEPGTAAYDQIRQNLQSLFDRYDRAIQLWSTVREGIIKMTPAGQLRSEIIDLQRSWITQSQANPFF